ncbi:unnamed protein product, partial [Phytomonas sp. EM1]
MLRRNFFRLAGLDKVMSLEKAVADIPDNVEIAFGGFGCAGVPYALIKELKKRGVKGITAYTDSAGIEGWGLSMLMEQNQLKRICCSYVGVNKFFSKRYLDGDLELEFVPQGTLAERMRSGGAGIPAFYTATAYGTQCQTGGQIVKYDKSGNPCMISEPKETRCFDGRWYVMERTIRPHYAFIRAHKADRAGNLIFRAMSRNFNVPAAYCGKCVIAEVEHLVENGEIDPDEVHLPRVYVHRVVQAPKYEIPIEQRTVFGEALKASGNSARQLIARRAALEFEDGMHVNLGIGIPTEAANYIPPGVSVSLQSENGLIGMGPFPTEDKVDPEWINAGKQTITYLPGAACFDSATSFAQIRGGHIQLSMLGALEVAANGDLANWCIPGKLIKGPGGAMDLVSSGSRVVVTMTHTNKDGEPKILERCRLPVTGIGCVSRIITEKAVFDVEQKQLVLKELAEGVTVEEVKSITDAHFKVCDGLKKMPLASIPN